VAPLAPQQFQSHVTHAAQVKKDGVFPEFQKKSPRKDYFQNSENFS
jgi:hypothetical protein